MIELSHVTRRYDGQSAAALDDVSLQIAPAEFVAITGPSGCGKSTLMHLIGGMDQPTSGEIVVDSLPLHRAGEKELTEYRRRKLGIVFQFFNLLPTMTVLENAALPLLLQGVPQAEADLRAGELLEMVGLTPRLHHLPSQLSGGEMQRAAIARALVHRPSVPAGRRTNRQPRFQKCRARDGAVSRNRPAQADHAGDRDPQRGGGRAGRAGDSDERWAD
ncbi:MAG: ABC transporter ATP-binding protein [Chthoniobacteraceae bacterium]